MRLREFDDLEILEQEDQVTESPEKRSEGKQPGMTNFGGTGRKRKGTSRGGKIILTILACAAVFLLILYMVLVLRKDRAEDVLSEQSGNRTYTQQELDERIAQAVQEAKEEEAGRILGGIRKSLSEGMAVAKSLRPFYPDEVVVATSGRIRFFPIQDGIKKNQYQSDNVAVLDNGELQYVENGQVLSHKGIDVSYHQGEIDWKQVAEDGVEFAVIRAGLRGYGTGRVVPDEQFENNVKGAIANGIKVGVYFYSQSVNEDEVLEEAALVLEMIAPYKITGPVVYDAEKVADSRTSRLTMDERTSMTRSFCKMVEDAGYRPMVYLNMDTAFSAVDLMQLEEYDKWFAHYGDEMYYPYEYKIWQYSEKGTVKGISGEVDLNISFEDWE